MQEAYGYRHLIPAHQGRGAEHLLARVLIQPGQLVPSNLYFTTSRVHAELAGGVWTDVSIPEASNPASVHPFKGNIDLVALERVLAAAGAGADRVRPPGGVPEHGGRPAVLDREPARRPRADPLSRRPVHPRRDPRLRERAVREAARARLRGPDARRRSSARSPISPTARSSRSKKDHFVPIGGLLALNDDALAAQRTRARRRLRGLPALRRHRRRTTWRRSPRGIHESTRRADRRPLRRRSPRYLGGLLLDAGVPVVAPARRPRRLPRREAVPSAPATGAVPGAVAGGGDLPRGRGADDGARDRLRPARRASPTTGSSSCG